MPETTHASRPILQIFHHFALAMCVFFTNPFLLLVNDCSCQRVKRLPFFSKLTNLSHLGAVLGRWSAPYNRECAFQGARDQTGPEGRGPGRPGWLPTQVPHRSGLAHHAHPVPHLMNSRPPRSVVGTWTWFRSRCTCQVSLQRLMRRHPLPLTGSLGLVPPLQRYSEVLRLP